MAEFKLGRIKFVWKGSWTASTVYVKDDVVRFGGKTYICVVGHTADSNFNTDLNYNPTKWNLVSDGQRWLDSWAVSSIYEEGDVVKYGGNLYLCNTGHTSAATSTLGLENDSAKWDTYLEGFDWKGVWATSTRYKINDIVSYGGRDYICNLHHTSASTATLGLENDLAKWDQFTSGIDYVGEWVTATRYKVNDVVKSGGGLWICTIYHTAGATFTGDSANWSQLSEGIEYESSWSNSTEYQTGDIVSYGGNQYISKTRHTASNPLTGTANWDLFSEGIKWQGAWNLTTSYKINEVVAVNGNNFLATTDSGSFTTSVTSADAGTKNFVCTSTTDMAVGMAVRFTGSTFGNVFTSGTYYVQQIVNSTTFKITTIYGGAAFTPTTQSGTMTATFAAKPPHANYWTEINKGLYWKGAWSDDVEYVAGDIVRYGSNAYICILAHRSEGDDGSTLGATGGGQSNSRPDQDTAGTYWNIFNLGTETAVMTTLGDMVYYDGAGPARLPRGTEGQVLRVSSTGIPEWTSWGAVDHVYYVSTDGEDRPWPGCGSTLDKPWKTIRYAAEQVLKGPLNPDAQFLLEMNRVFIQREVSEWIDYQIANNIAPFTTSFVYAQDRCERDIGWIVDALIYDLGHGGNVRTRGAALAYVNGLTEHEEVSPYLNLAAEADEDVAAYEYMSTLLESVLANEAPAANYQVLNGDNSTAVVSQFINSNFVAETEATTRVTDLLSIVITALEDQDDTNIPDRVSPNNTINIRTGQYRETLPIIVPEDTVMLGDELRSTHAGPSESVVDISDSKYSQLALTRLETVVGQIVLGSNVTESSGNTLTQSIEFPLAQSAQDVLVRRLVRMMQHRIDYKVNSTHMVNYTLPTGYNGAFLSGYGDARTLLQENREFLKDEIIAYIAVNYPTVKYSKTACRRDVGYIVDAVIYDITYDGSTQTLNAGLAYFDGPGSTLLIDSTELQATIQSYNRLKTVMQQIVANTTVTKSVGNSATQWTDSTNLTGGSAASSAIGTKLDIIINILTAGATTGRPNLTITSITGTNTLNTTAAHGLAAGDLVVPRTTAYGLTANVRYYVLSSGLTATAFQLSTTYGGSLLGSLTNGSGLTYVVDTEDRPTVTNAVTTTTALITAYTTLSAAVNTIVTNMTNFITSTYPALVYNSSKCERDARIILDAVGYDFMFNTNFQSLKAAFSYLRSSASDVFDNNQKDATRAAFNYVKDQAKSNVGGDATAQSRIETLMTTLDDVIFGATSEGSTCSQGSANVDYAILQLERNRDYIVEEIDAYISSTFTTTVTNSSTAQDVLTCSDTSWMKRNTAVRFSGTLFGGLSSGTNFAPQIYYIQNVVSSTTFKISTSRNSNTALNLVDGTGSMTMALYYDSALCLRDVNAYLDALKFDLKFTGNYKSLLAARYYANAVTGSLEEDMYYVRNGTGIRNQTLENLTGDLLAENSYGTRRVSAGAYVSLDPGFGPDDYHAWIITRSPYVQNVTTFGTAAIGQKIDGSLHNGGNDSIVSNDFTQVISDGIGAWVTNNGRAELVSVFTYYSHIGYLAENGGRIRGTNGNNSYGDFGSVAEGFDATETPITGLVDNKGYDVAVGSVLTDGSDDIYHFEFDNAGSDYTTASWSIVGGEGDAEVEQLEFRDGAVFQVRLLDNIDDSSNAPEADGNYGGFGYISNANTAQGGTSTQISLAATDEEISSAYVGMRVVITGGAGAGQHGRILTYNSGTKVATVYKETLSLVTAGSFSVSSVYRIESLGTTVWNTVAGTTGVTYAVGDIFTCANAGTGTGTAFLMSAGWDHWISGTTIESPDASSTYVVEPAVTFTRPTYSSTSRTLATNQTYVDAAYAETHKVYPSSGALTVTGGTGSGATFVVVRKGNKYSDVDIVSAGTNYTRLDTLTIVGTNLGGTSTTNDLTITVTSVNSTTGAITAIEFTGTGIGGNFIALSTSQTVDTSSNGTSWTARTNVLPSASNWRSMAAGKLTSLEVVGTGLVTGRGYVIQSPANTVWSFLGANSPLSGTYFVYNGYTGAGYTSTTGTVYPIETITVAVSNSTTVNAYSTDAGVTWSSGTALPAGMSGTAVGVAYGDGRWVVVGSGGATCYSTNAGVSSWTAGGALPGTGYVGVAYGGGKFVAVASGGNQAAYSTDGGATWTTATLPGSSNWNSVTYGNNRFVAVSNSSNTIAAYSIDGITWTLATLPATAQWTNVRYGQGVFLAVNQTNDNAASSVDGVNWQTRALTRASGTGFEIAVHGNPGQSGIWAAIPYTSTTAASSAILGATATGRVFVQENKIFAIRLIEPGSTYTVVPTIGITDPNNIYEAPTTVRIGNGACANPSFVNRGTAYNNASVTLDTGDGYADNFQSGRFIAMKRLTDTPQAGANVVFDTQPNTVYKLVQVLSLTGTQPGAISAFFQISPEMSVFNSPANNTPVTTRIRYSQVRLTGHDFLDIGTGSFIETNYPNTPTQEPNQANETVDNNGGRVFYTSTDQDGNFRVGELFTIEQSTGVATLNAEAFNIAGLSELTLGSVTLGGSSATVTEFSTDPFFTANSDSVVPTQRAIKSYIASQIGGGGASLNVNSVVAGFIEISGQQITTTTGGTIQMKANFNFQSGVIGLPIAWNYFLT